MFPRRTVLAASAGLLLPPALARPAPAAMASYPGHVRDPVPFSITDCYPHVLYPWSRRAIRMRLVRPGDTLPDPVKSWLLGGPTTFGTISSGFRAAYGRWVPRFDRVSGLKITVVSYAGPNVDWFVLSEPSSLFGTRFDAFTTYPGGATRPYVVTSWRSTVASRDPAGTEFDVGVGAEIGRGAGIPDPPCGDSYSGDSIEGVRFLASKGRTDYGRDDKRALVRAYGAP